MARPNRAQRRQAERAGQRAERLAALFLRLKGYRCLARQVVTPYGEIDLVCRRGKTVIFVEVKRRSTAIEPGLAVNRKQQARIARAAASLAETGRFGRDVSSFRIDLVLMVPGRLPVHLSDAWR